MEDELRAWNVDVHCRSLVRFWTARLKKHGADNGCHGSNPYCHYGDEKKVAHEIRRLQNHDNLGEESIIVLAQLLDASVTVFKINPLGNVTINDGSGKSGTISLCGVFNDVPDVQTKIYLLQSGLNNWCRKADCHCSRVHPADAGLVLAKVTPARRVITIVDSPDSEDIGNNTFENDVDFDDGYHVDNADNDISNDIFEGELIACTRVRAILVFSLLLFQHC